MNTSYLRHFYEVSRFGSFLQAAKEIKVSQPNLSRSVRLLEEDLGVKLMLRGKGGIKLTEPGRYLYSEARQFFERLDHVENDLKKKPASRILRIAASENLCIHILPKAVKDILKTNAYSSVDLYSGTAEQIEQRVSDSQADFGLSYHSPQSPWLKKRLLSNVVFKLILPRQTTRKDIPAMPFIGSRAGDYSKPYFAISVLQKNKIKPAWIIESNSQEAQIKMVAEGIGYTVAPIFLAHAYASEVSLDREFTESAKIHGIFRNDFPIEIWNILKNHFDKV